MAHKKVRLNDKKGEVNKEGKDLERDRKDTDRRERLVVVREKRMEKDEMKDEVRRTETEGVKIWKGKQGEKG